jgi:hypothetical protein
MERWKIENNEALLHSLADIISVPDAFVKKVS